MIGARSGSPLVALGALVLVIAGCPPSDEDFLNVGKQQVLHNCCSSNKDSSCIPCPMLEGAHVTWAKAGNGDAAHGRRVEVGFDGPHGAGTCYYGVGWVGGNTGALSTEGGTCRPNGPPSAPSASARP